MTGVIWIVQLVHYPAFLFVDRSRFKEFSRFHSARISWIVMPIMICELLAALALVFYEPNWLWRTNGALLAGIWLSTFALSVPLHNRLAKNGFNEGLVSRLIVTNWPRTALWTLRSVLILYFA